MLNYVSCYHYSVSIREACVHGFLHTSAGEALLAIAGTGVDTLEQKIIEQGR